MRQRRQSLLSPDAGAVTAGRWAAERWPAPVAQRARVRWDQREMVMLPGSVAWFPALSVTLMVNVNVPAAVGVPLRWLPVSTTPGGSCPAATCQVNGPTPPEEKKFW